MLPEAIIYADGSSSPKTKDGGFAPKRSRHPAIINMAKKINWEELTHLTCYECGEVKEKEKFAKRYGKRSGTYQRICKYCKHKKYKENFKKRNGISLDSHYRNHNRTRVNFLKRKYNLTIDQYNEIFSSQEGKCAICGNQVDYNLAVDHDHTTGKIRGLLCITCNLGIGNYFTVLRF